MMTPNMLGDTGILLAGVTEEPKSGKTGKESLSIASPSTQLISIPKPSTSTAQQSPDSNEYEWKIVWRNILGMIYLHVGGVYGIYLMFTQARLITFVWGKFP